MTAEKLAAVGSVLRLVSGGGGGTCQGFTNR